MNMPDMPSEGIWRWERRVYPQKISNLLWICLTCPRREYGVGSVGYIHRRLVTRARGSSNGSACPRFVLPAPRSPDGHTIREDHAIPTGCSSATSIMPVTNPLERLNKEVKRRADVVGIFPGEASITRLIGAVLLEQNDEWRTDRRYMQLEGMAELTPPAAEAEPAQIPPRAA